MKTVVGLFKTQARARDVLYKLQAAGFDPQGVSVITGNSSTPQDADIGREGTDNTVQHHDGPFGGLLDMLLVPGMNAIQGVAQPLREPIVDDVGEVETHDNRVEVGSIPAPLPENFHRTLAQWGLSSVEVSTYEKHVANGGVLVAVQAAGDQDAARIQQILQQDGAGDVTASSA
jgi:hypothetical protein